MEYKIQTNGWSIKIKDKKMTTVKKAKEEDILYISEEVKKLIPVFIKSGW